MPLLLLPWPPFSSRPSDHALLNPSPHSFIPSLPFPIVVLRKADCPSALTF
jgi:hypothetical protein